MQTDSLRYPFCQLGFFGSPARENHLLHFCKKSAKPPATLSTDEPLLFLFDLLWEYRQQVRLLSRPPLIFRRDPFLPFQKIGDLIRSRAADDLADFDKVKRRKRGNQLCTRSFQRMAKTLFCHAEQ